MKIAMLVPSIVSYGNLYLSNQLELDDSLTDNTQFDNNFFKFLTQDGVLFADYLAQWLECQKKRGVKRFALQQPSQIISPLYHYRDISSIICQFANKEEIWSCSYPKTIACNAYNLDLKNNDIKDPYANRDLTFILTETKHTVTVFELTDWLELKQELIANLNQAWPTSKAYFLTQNIRYFYNYFEEKKFYPWHLPVLPPDKNLLLPHQLLIGLKSLEFDYKEKTNGKNESNVYYTLAKDKLDCFLEYGDRLKQWNNKVSLLAGNEIRWQVTKTYLTSGQYIDDENITLPLDEIPIATFENMPIEIKVETIATTQTEITTKPKLPKKSCLIGLLIMILCALLIGSALYYHYWMMLIIVVVLYFLIKK